MWIRRPAGSARPDARDHPPAGAAAPPLHALQRMIGNRAVVRALAGRWTAVQRDDAADMRAMGQKARLVTHASMLDELPEAELTAKVAAMSPGEAKELLAAVPLTSMHRVRGALLSRLYDHSLGLKLWRDAVGYLQGFDDPGITERVNRLKNAPDDRRELIIAALDNSRVLGLMRAATGLAIDATKPFGELVTTGFAAKQEGRGNDAPAGTIRIEFVPNPDLVSADEIAFVQTIRRVRRGSDSTEGYAHGLDDRATRKGTAVDRFGRQKYGFFGYEGSGQPGTSATKGHCRSAADKQPASMTDTPGKISNTENTFEACAVAKGGKDTGRVYGCLVWGFVVDDDYRVTVKPHEFRLKTSSEFEAAVGKWNKQAAEDSHGQQALPALR